MNYESITLSITDKVALLTLNRPASLNTMHPVLWRELTHALQGLKRSGEARVLVLASTGKHFTAGMALDVFTGGAAALKSTANDRERFAADLRDMQSVFDLFEDLRMPVISAIQGGCIGGGVDMVCATDIRLTTADAYFCIMETNIGMAADIGTLQRLPKLIPEGVVHELAYTGRKLPAQRALALGLVNEIFENHEALLAGALQMAREIAEKSPLAVWGSKQAIHYARDHATRDALQQMCWLQAGIWQTGDLLESFMAKQEGRAPRFPDLAPLTPFSELNYTLK